MDNKKYIEQIESFVNNKIACGMMTTDDAFLFTQLIINPPINYYSERDYARKFTLEEAEFNYYASHGSFEGFPYDPFEKVNTTTVLL